MRIDFDNDREWISWWIEDEEWRLWLEQWFRDFVPGYDPSYVDRGVIEGEI